MMRKNTLVVQYNGEHAGKRYGLEDKLVKIGRSTDNKISLLDTSISDYMQI